MGRRALCGEFADVLLLEAFASGDPRRHKRATCALQWR
jgi:hypothetical protein